MEFILNEKVKAAIDVIGNKTRRNNALKLYYYLTRKAKYTDGKGFFECPSSYLVRINKRYSTIMAHFINEGILEYYKGNRQIDLFTTKETKYYNTETGVCARYRFLVDITMGKKVELSFKCSERRWYTIVKESLISLGYEPKISRDGFGLRVHHPAIYDYKKALAGKGFSKIDAKASHPKLLYQLMKVKGLIDQQYFAAFEDNDKCFYDYLVEKLNLSTRKRAKNLFMFWVNGKNANQCPEIGKLFPGVSNFLKNLKRNSYKSSPKMLQRIESQIWIDKILNDIPVAFALPVHDCLIVKTEDLGVVLEYCSSVIPTIELDVSSI